MIKICKIINIITRWFNKKTNIYFIVSRMGKAAFHYTVKSCPTAKNNKANAEYRRQFSAGNKIKNVILVLLQ